MSSFCHTVISLITVWLFVVMSLPPLFSMFLQSIWIGAGINVLIAGHLRKREQEEANKTVALGLET